MSALSSIGLPLGFEQWMPHTQALVLGLMTFVQEDVPMVGAALMAAAGDMSWQAGFLGVFLGIWVGDALLYLAARAAGRPLLQRSWARRFFNADSVERSEKAFARNGAWLLIGCRFMPGTRLPTYLAAGFLRLPFGRFLALTGAAVAAWTTMVFLLARAAGPELLEWLRRWSSGGWSILVLLVVGVLVARTAPRIRWRAMGRRWAAMAGRLTRWEFWPAWLFYAPVAAWCARLALLHRSATLPTAANPGMFSGGFVGESKFATLEELQTGSPEFTAEACRVPSGTLEERRRVLAECCERRGWAPPYVLKPDVGQRGVGVRVIRSPEQAEAYLQRCAAALVVQRYIPGPKEAGVFYYRFPHEPRGRIFAITEKLFPSVIGDGDRTIEELIWNDGRARYLAGTYLRRLGTRRSVVPAPGERVRLVEAGNHAQGCVFRDGWRLWTEALELQVDRISQRLDGFYIGRYDLRYESEAELRSGRGFRIIELNGAAAEATNIYDPDNSLAQAYRTLFRQWELVFAIAAANRRGGTVPIRAAALWRAWRESAALAATYPLAD